MRRQVPQRIVLGMELAKAKSVRVDVADLAEFAIVDQPLQRLEGGMETQDMADHEDAAIVLGRLHRALGVRHRQRDRLFHQQILAALSGAHGKIRMELRRQGHDDGVDIVTHEQLVGLDRQAILFAGKAFGTGPVGVGNRVQRAERLEGADMVAAPVSATEDCNARLHLFQTLKTRGRDIATCPFELNPGRCNQMSTRQSFLGNENMRRYGMLRSLTGSPSQPYIRATLANASKCLSI